MLEIKCYDLNVCLLCVVVYNGIVYFVGVMVSDMSGDVKV